jgi:hypothetical protein
MLSQGQVRIADSSSLDTTGSAEAPHALGSLSTFLALRRYILNARRNTMKKILAILLLSAIAIPAMAQHHGYGGYRGGHHGHGHRHGGWAPFIGGAVVGAVIYDIYNRPIVVQQPPVIIQPPIVVQPGLNCSPWTETQNYDGSITRTRTCAQ